MKTRRISVQRPWGVLSSAALLAVLVLLNATPASAAYVGSDTCGAVGCHQTQYNEFRVSGHPYKLRTAADAKANPLPLPSGLTWADISYVIGGYKWKARYMGTDGYIITSPGGFDGSNQYNLATGTFSDYHAGEVKSYDCGSCHTTGYSASGNQDGLAGIVGTWEFPGIQCEECHGEGSTHVASPSTSNITVNTSASACGACHVRNDETVIEASGGFIQHHEQWDELVQSPHSSQTCVACHDPHKKSEFSIDTECTECHTGYADVKKAFKGPGRKMVAMGIECHDCHMPYAVKSAVAENSYKGDVRSHLFSINLDKNATLLNEAGTAANGYLTPAFACLGCHVEVTAKMTDQKAVKWARKMSKKIHKKVQ